MLVAWFAAAVLAVAASIVVLPRVGAEGYLTVGIALLILTIGAVTLWRGRAAANSDRQSVLRWLGVALMALTLVAVLVEFVRYALHGRYLPAAVFLLFSWVLVQAIRDSLKRRRTPKKGADGR